jgi:uroporphyrinogen-III decarboxylase
MYTIPTFPVAGSEGEEMDEWGCRWKKWGKGLIGEPVGHPLDDWETLKEFAWPEMDAPVRYAHIEPEIENAGDKYVQAGIDGILRRARFLRGFASLMQDFYLEPAKVHELLEGLLDITLRILRRYHQFDGIHGISMPEDWGTQTQPFVKTPMFREFFTPIYKRLIDTIHSYGWTLRMHSDGRINDLIEEYIACGLDIVELEQPRALGIEEIGRRYRGRICLEGSIDIQATLPRLDPQAIREEARQLVNEWATPEGGLIAVCYHGPDIGVPDELIKVAFEAFQEFGWRKS